jgi:hypothetical protein
MGVVFRATRDDGERVALKILRGELAEDELYRHRFSSARARIGSELVNEHIVQWSTSGRPAVGSTSLLFTCPHRALRAYCLPRSAFPSLKQSGL